MDALARSRGDGAGAWIRREWGLALVCAATAAFDGAAAIIRHVHLQSGLDLAIFDQAVWRYSRLEAPFSSIKGENLLGDHFHPVVAVLAPLYWVWSDPRMLLIGQSVLVAASIIPVFLFARPRLGRTGAYLLAGAYAGFWGVQVGVLYEFHEVAFAPLLIGLSILLADRRRWGWMWLTIVLLLGVKEDLAIFVVFFGAYLLSRRDFRRGLALVVVGVGWYELATRVAIPHFAGGVGYTYWTYGQLGRDLPDAVGAMVRSPWRLVTIGTSPAQKVQTMAGLLAPFLFLSLGSRLFILALPLLAERFLSSNPAFWSSHYQYSLAIAPVLAMAAAEGLAGLARLAGPRVGGVRGAVEAGVGERGRRLVVVGGRLVVVGGAAGMLAASLAITRLATPDAGLSQITRPSFYRAPAYAAGVYEALARVPGGASVATDDFVLPHVSRRDRVDLVEPGTIGRDEYVVVNVLAPACCGDAGNASSAALGQVVAAELAKTTPIYYDRGWLVGRRPPGGGRAGSGVLRPLPAAGARQVADLSRRWVGAIGAALAGAPCAAGASCVEAPGRALTTALGGAVGILRGGCADVAGAALGAVARLTADVSRAQGSGPGRTRAIKAAEADERDHGLSGQVERFLVLCTPRGNG